MLYPHLQLLVSGGNSQLIYLRSWKDFEIIGATLDDAAGECFDKVGRMLGLLYPGGVYLSRIAGLEDKNILKFPVSMKDSNDYNFSFSGLKTAVRYYLEKFEFENGEHFILEKKLNSSEIDFLINHNLAQIEKIYAKNSLITNIENTPKIKTESQTEDDLNFELLLIVKKACITVQSVIVEALLNKVDKATATLEVESIGLSGGVSANPLLRQKLQQKYGNILLLAPKALTGDNAVMIGLAGILEWKNR